jgi:hypothetical protein
MAIAEMSPGHQYAICSLLERFNNKYRINTARTHNPDSSQVGWILQPGYSCQISPGISTPVTQKRHNFRLKLCHNLLRLKILGYSANTYVW